MREEEIREAASCVSCKAPSEREQFLKESYQTATAREIELIKRLVERIDDAANNYPCKYNGGFYYELQ